MINVCVYLHILNLNRIQIIRGTESYLLSISFVKPHKRVSKDTVSRWVKISLDRAGIDATQFKLHSTRQAFTSAAKKNAAVWKKF